MAPHIRNSIELPGRTINHTRHVSPNGAMLLPDATVLLMFVCLQAYVRPKNLEGKRPSLSASTLCGKELEGYFTKECSAVRHSGHELCRYYKKRPDGINVYFGVDARNSNPIMLPMTPDEENNAYDSYKAGVAPTIEVFFKKVVRVNHPSQFRLVGAHSNVPVGVQSASAVPSIRHPERNCNGYTTTPLISTLYRALLFRTHQRACGRSFGPLYHNERPVPLGEGMIFTEVQPSMVKCIPGRVFDETTCADVPGSTIQDDNVIRHRPLTASG